MQTPQFSCPANYQVIEKLGQGSFGEVMLVQQKGTKGQLRALKRIYKASIVKLQKMHQVFIERQILREFLHYQNNRCVSIYDTDSNQQYIFMILQYCQGGSLDKIIPDIAALEEKQKEILIPNIAAKILLALIQIHSKKVIHRDLKPSNLLMTKFGDIKLADFGASYAPVQFYHPQAWEKIQNIKKVMNQNKQRKMSEEQAQTIQINSAVRKATFVGTAYYMAPELLTDDICQIEADLWAYGCIVYQLASGRPPFYDSNQGMVWKKIVDQDPSTAIDSDNGVPHLKSFVRSILKKNRHQRLGAKQLNHQQLKKHPFFAKVNWSQIQLSPINQLIPIINKKKNQVFKKKSTSSIKPEQKKILFSGIVFKKMFFGNFKQRMLVLNSTPQLIYYDPQSGQQKGQICLNKNISIGLEGNKYFAITNQKKTYHFKSAKANEWVQMMKNAIQIAYY